MSTHAIVVGGGWAGIAAASALADSGARVTLLEARRQWGGRATSWPDPKYDDVVDNGQHVLLGCYDETTALLRRLGTAERVRFPGALRLVMREPGGRQTVLDASRAPGKLGLGLALFTWDRLPLFERVSLARAVATAPPPSATLSVAQWLDQLGQGESARRFFWRPLIEAALNETDARAPAILLHAVIVRAFRAHANAAAIGVPACGLAELVAPIAPLLEARGGSARLGVHARAIAPAPGGGFTVELEDEPALTAPTLVLAVPAAEARALVADALPDLARRIAPAAQLEGSPIVTATLWYDGPVMPSPLIGLVAPPTGHGPGFHWAFDRSAWLGGAASGRHAVTLVASVARDLAPRPTGEILERAHATLELYGITARRALFGRVVKEPHATPALTAENLEARADPDTGIRGFALAGDWTRQALPATIEAAVASGHRSARLVRAAL